jgi:hypothetical protein
MFDSFKTSTGEFKTIFGEFPEISKSAGTGFGTNANSEIQSGAGTAGGIFGSTAVEAIKAGVANLNINVNANVKSTTSGADQGARPSD